MKIIEELMPGLMLLQANEHPDHRGVFVKTFNAEAYERMGLPLTPMEIIFSVSKKDVVRGMHFQVPPADHQKLVSCSVGAILDVALDLRRGSPTYGKFAAVELNDKNRHALLLPRGFAHGFLSLEDQSLVAYCTDTGHAPACDKGVRWDSFGFDWPVANPVISEKDLNQPALADFDTPFA